MVAGGRHAVQVVESAHESAHTRVDGCFEGRKVNRAQSILGQVGGVVVTTCFSSAIGHPMLGASDEFVSSAVVRSLKATHARSRHSYSQEGIFTGAFSNASPASVTGYVEHRREGPMNTGSPGLSSSDCGAFFHRRGIPARGFAEWNRKHRAIPVNDIKSEDQRNLES